MTLRLRVWRCSHSWFYRCSTSPACHCSSMLSYISSMPSRKNSHPTTMLLSTDVWKLSTQCVFHFCCFVILLAICHCILVGLQPIKIFLVSWSRKLIEINRLIWINFCSQSQAWRLQNLTTGCSNLLRTEAEVMMMMHHTDGVVKTNKVLTVKLTVCKYKSWSHVLLEISTCHCCLLQFTIDGWLPQTGKPSQYIINRQGQISLPSLHRGWIEYKSACWVKVRHVHLCGCQMAWSHMAGDAS